MPRSARVVIANQPHHIIQRGHNRQVVFAQDEDYVYYSDTLAEWKEKLGCKIYAYCLLTNHTLIQWNQLTGSKQYIDAIEEKIGKRVECRGQGRPR